jgi:hypothetical protein
MAFFGTTMFAVRSFLSQSIAHFALTPILFFLTACVFFAIAAQFNSFFSEFDTNLAFIVRLVLLLLPLFASTLLSMMLSLELPADFELHTIFSVCYFLYALYFCRPRSICVKSMTRSSGSGKSTAVYHHEQFISSALLRIVYILPVFITLAVHIALHRHVSMTNRSRVLSLVNAILLSTLLMLYCRKQHLYRSLAIELSPQSESPSNSLLISSIRNQLHFANKVFNGLLLFFAFSVQGLPVFDELKHFCGLAEPIPSIVLFAIVLLVVIASLLQQRTSYHKSFAEGKPTLLATSFGNRNDDSEAALLYQESFTVPDSERQRHSTWRLVFRVLFDFVTGLTVALCAMLVNLSQSIVPISFIAAIALAELHFEENWEIWTRAMLGIIGGLAVTISFISFCKGLFRMFSKFHSNKIDENCLL